GRRGEARAGSVVHVETVAHVVAAVVVDVTEHDEGGARCGGCYAGLLDRVGVRDRGAGGLALAGRQADFEVRDHGAARGELGVSVDTVVRDVACDPKGHVVRRDRDASERRYRLEVRVADLHLAAKGPGLRGGKG